MKYKILFIDEEKSQHNQFLNYMDSALHLLDVECLLPEPDIDTMIDRIEDIHPDAIITDYLLNDIKTDVHENISYTGVDLVVQYRAMRPNFPCFVLTSYDDDAVCDVDDVNLIYVKKLLSGEDTSLKSKFYEKIYFQIKKYKASIDQAQVELKNLLEKRNKGIISLDEEQRLIDLDDFLEKSLDNYHAVPAEMKKLSNIKNMSVMIEKLDEVLKRID